MRTTWVLALCWAVRLSAQSAVVSGTVIGRDSAPLANAHVNVVGTGLSAVASQDGVFRLAGVPSGARTLLVTMVGYTPLLHAIDTRGGETLTVHIALAPLGPVELPAFEVRPDILGPLRDFEERRARGPGKFFTRAEIERLQPRQVTDVLRRVSALEIRPVSGAYGQNLLVTSRGARCSVAFYLNGSPFLLPPDIPINHFVNATDLIAMEIYSPSEVPPQYNSSVYAARCGVVGIWTRNGK